MRAIVYGRGGGPGVLRLVDKPVCARPKATVAKPPGFIKLEGHPQRLLDAERHARGVGPVEQLVA